MAAFLYLRVDFIKSGSLGPHRMGILDGIDRLGSISATARVIGMSYRQVWVTVHQLNKMYPHPVMSVKPAGPKGGATLTSFGKKVLKQYRAMEKDANKALDRHLKAFQRLMEEDPATPVAVPGNEGVVLWTKPLGRKVGRRPSTARPKKRRAKT